MGIKEYGQAASEVELQDNPGPIKNQEGEAVIETVSYTHLRAHET